MKNDKRKSAPAVEERGRKIEYPVKAIKEAVRIAIDGTAEASQDSALPLSGK